MSALDMFEIGKRVEIGSHTFTADAIVAYAQKYDPQPFHVDEEAARNSMFGGLCASGWHTTAVWMKKNLEYGEMRDAELKAQGKTPPVMGPSPGLSNLKWLRPVYANDTIRFFNTVTSARQRQNNPEWGIVELFSEGYNQNGDKVVEFDNAVLVRM
ncbi:MaoC family dehydratase [Hoeflea sp. TYP-13]|uniref:MaoC family dehydratase n=1 Tax=Hoeflea sp. TYP-13 TaxID=3230023 RepID=UPI0034C5D8F1